MNSSMLLLDTHVFLWWRMDDPRLSSQARERIAHAGIVYVSAASAWEASIKAGLGRLRLPEPFRAGVAGSGFLELPVRFSHAERAGALPQHHRDPFDRMLVAQAMEERLTLVSHDRWLRRYGVEMIRT